MHSEATYYKNVQNHVNGKSDIRKELQDNCITFFPEPNYIFFKQKNNKSLL